MRPMRLIRYRYGLAVGLIAAAAGCGASGQTSADHINLPSLGPLSPSAAGASPPSCSASTSNKFAQAVSATSSENGVLVHAHPAQLVCGGVDDVNYTVATADETLTLSRSASVSVVIVGTSGVGTQQIPASGLPQWLTTDKNGRIFQVVGAESGLTGLSEMYHP